MAKTKKSPSYPLAATGSSGIRPGEVALTAARTVVPRPDGSTEVSLAFELEQAPVPNRRYFADRAWVTSSPNGCRLLFGQERVDGEHLRSLIIISMTTDAVRNFARTLERFLPNVANYVAATGRDSDGYREITEEPPQTVSIRATAIACAHAADEGCMDFFQISPWSVHRMGDQIGIEPMARIDLSTALMLRVITDLAVAGGNQ